MLEKSMMTDMKILYFAVVKSDTNLNRNNCATHSD